MSEPLSEEWFIDVLAGLVPDGMAGGINGTDVWHALHRVAAEAMRWAAERVDATPGIKHQGAASAAILRRAEEIEGVNK